MINDSIKKAIHCAEDSIDRFTTAKLNLTNGLYTHSLCLLGTTFNKKNFNDYVRANVLRIYDEKYVINSISHLPFCATASIIYKNYKTLQASILAERGKNMINNINVTDLSAPKGMYKIYYKLKRFLPNLIKVEDMVCIATFAAEVGGNELDFCIKRMHTYSDVLLSKTEGLVHSVYNTTSKKYFPDNKFILSTCGYYLLALELISEKYDGFKNDILSKNFYDICNALKAYVSDNGYYPTSNHKNDTYDSLASLLIANAFFYGYSKGYLTREFYESAEKTYCVVINDLKMKNGLLSLPHIANTPYLFKYFGLTKVNNIFYGDDLPQGIAALNYATVNYSKCLELIDAINKENAV